MTDSTERGGVMPFLRDNAWVSCALFALLVRLAFVILQEKFTILDIAFDASDSVLYRGLAESLSSGDGFAFNGAPTAYVTPGYPLFLAPLYLISKSTIFIGVIQAFVGAATVGLIASMAARLGGSTAGWSAGLLAAIYPHSVFWTGYVLTETMYVFSVILALYLTLRAAAERSTRWAVVAGLAWGYAALVRPTALGFAVVVAIAGLATSYKRVALVGTAGVVLLVGAWTVRNVVTMDAFIVTSTETGVVLYQGNSPGATGGTGGYVDGRSFTPLELPDDMPEIERGRIYQEKALEWMRENPGEVAALVPKKLWNMFRPTYEGSSSRNALVTFATYPLLMAGGLIGLWKLRDRGVAGFLFIGFFLYSLVVHGLATGMIRFRLPIEVALMPPFGVAIAILLEKKRS